MAHHELMGGKLHIYKRENSHFWQCAVFIGGRNLRMSTKEEGIGQARDVAEEWYLELRGKYKRGELKHGKTLPRQRHNSLASSRSLLKASGTLNTLKTMAAG